MLENRSETERFDWSDFFAVLAVTYGTVDVTPQNNPTGTIYYSAEHHNRNLGRTAAQITSRFDIVASSDIV